jgi:hypothetical protein
MTSLYFANLLGEIFGGMIGIFVVSALVEWAVCKRVFDDPIKGKLTSVLVAYLLGSIGAGYGQANGGPYEWGAFFDYAIPAVIVGCFAYVSGKRLKEKMGADGAREVFE